MNLHELAITAGNKSDDSQRPVRLIQRTMKDEAFVAAVDSIKNVLTQAEIGTERGSFMVTTSDAAATLKSLYNSVYGPQRKLTSEAAQQIVDEWLSEE